MAGAADPPLADSQVVIALDDALVLALHARAGAARWDVTPERFAQALTAAVGSRFGAIARPAPSVRPATPTPKSESADPPASAPVSSPAATMSASSATQPAAEAVARFLDSLQLEDLALAVACADRHEPAWNAFVAAHRPDLRRAASAMAGADRADDLCGALLGELFGVDARGRERASLFRYFHGRSRLSTWLRAVLAQRHVDLLRTSRRTVPLESDEQADALAPPVMPAAPDPDRGRRIAALQQAMDAALTALEPHARLRLVAYHVDGMTLAEMGRFFGEHEATASRKLTRIRTRLREAIEQFLQREHGLDGAQVRLCYEDALDAGGLDFAGLAESRMAASTPAAAASTSMPLDSVAAPTADPKELAPTPTPAPAARRAPPMTAAVRTRASIPPVPDGRSSIEAPALAATSDKAAPATSAAAVTSSAIEPGEAAAPWRAGEQGSPPGPRVHPPHAESVAIDSPVAGASSGGTAGGAAGGVGVNAAAGRPGTTASATASDSPAAGATSATSTSGTG